MGERTTTGEPLRELDHRESDGIGVSLLWNQLTDRLTVAVSDFAAGKSFELFVDGKDALEAFNHPYAYAAFKGVERSGCSSV